jgi:hypothetical protein
MNFSGKFSIVFLFGFAGLLFGYSNHHHNLPLVGFLVGGLLGVGAVISIIWLDEK